MPTIITEKETTTTVDEQGNERSTTVEKTRKYERSAEPEYIKIYTNMWCELNQIPLKWRGLFLQLAMRMTYADTSDPSGGQIVQPIGIIATGIMNTCGWKDRSMLAYGLQALCKCNAIKHVSRGCYQINPSYAGKGEWKYNPSKQQGGIEDIVATFSVADKSINTRIVWADDGQDTALNKAYREGMGVRAEQKTVLRETTAAPAGKATQ